MIDSIGIRGLLNEAGPRDADPCPCCGDEFNVRVPIDMMRGESFHFSPVNPPARTCVWHEQEDGVTYIAFHDNVPIHLTET